MHTTMKTKSKNYLFSIFPSTSSGSRVESRDYFLFSRFRKRRGQPPRHNGKCFCQSTLDKFVCADGDASSFNASEEKTSSKRRLAVWCGGQMVVESMIAASILTVGLLGALALLNRSLSLSRSISNNYIGTYLASEGVEIVKNLIDTNIIQSRPWNDGISPGDYEADYASAALAPYANRSLSFNPTAHLYYYGAGSQTNFTRRLRISMVGADEMRVNSIVTWSTGLAQSSLNVEDHFFNWRP